MAIPKYEADLNIIQKLEDEPNDVGDPVLSADELKAEFDKSGLTTQAYINEQLIPAIEGDGSPDNPGLVGQDIKDHNESPDSHQDIRQAINGNADSIKLKLDSATIKSDGIPEITDEDTLRDYFYKKRKETSRSWQFEIGVGKNTNIVKGLGGLPRGVEADTPAFVVINLPYTEAGGFIIEALYILRNGAGIWKKRLHATYSTPTPKWYDMGWADTIDSRFVVTITGNKSDMDGAEILNRLKSGAMAFVDEDAHGFLRPVAGYYESAEIVNGEFASGVELQMCPVVTGDSTRSQTSQDKFTIFGTDVRKEKKVNTLRQAGKYVLGGVMAAPATADMTEPVGIGEDGHLRVKPSGEGLVVPFTLSGDYQSGTTDTDPFAIISAVLAKERVRFKWGDGWTYNIVAVSEPAQLQPPYYAYFLATANIDADGETTQAEFKMDKADGSTTYSERKNKSGVDKVVEFSTTAPADKGLIWANPDDNTTDSIIDDATPASDKVYSSEKTTQLLSKKASTAYVDAKLNGISNLVGGGF